MSETILFPSGPTRPTASSPVRPARRWVLRPWLPWALVGLVLGLLVVEHFGGLHSEPDPEARGAAIGREVAPRVVEALAKGFDAAARALDQGESVEKANMALKTIFHDDRESAFHRIAGPTFDAIVPSGKEPKDETTRRAFAKLHRDFARGLRAYTP